MLTRAAQLVRARQTVPRSAAAIAHQVVSPAPSATAGGTRRFAIVNGIVVAPVSIAIAIGPAGGALLAARFGSYPTTFWLLAVLPLAGAALAITFHARAAFDRVATMRARMVGGVRQIEGISTY
jgi:hypothetical protein